MLRWYLIYTKPLSEAIAQANLERQGYEVYLPRLMQWVRGCAQRRDRPIPLFPRYLFLRLREGSQPLGPVRSSVGVSGVVRFGCRYAVVADEVICHLQARADPLTGLHRLTGPAPLVTGAPVRITTGPFDGLEGIFQREEGAERVVVLLRLLGQDRPIRVPAEWILPHCDSRGATRRQSAW